MILSLTREAHGVLEARLRDGDVDATVTSVHGHRAAAALVDAVEEAGRTGYGECFWPEPTGQYWWMFRQEDARLEVVVLWSSGAVTGWRHVFRAADEASWLRDRVRDEVGRCGGEP